LIAEEPISIPTALSLVPPAKSPEAEFKIFLKGLSILFYANIIAYMAFLNTILNVIFPANCISCGKKENILCIKCLADSPPAERENPK
jgi:hypothetical protein